MTRVGLLGCGNIGGIIAERSEAEIVAVHDMCPERANKVAQHCGATVVDDLCEFLHSDFDVLVEAASVDAVRNYASAALEAGKDLVILSIGGLVNTDFREALIASARTRGRRIHLPSGALAGLDAVTVGRISPLHTLRLCTTKPPVSLGVEVNQRTRVFSGPASACIEQFPRNINVAVTLSIAAGREADVELWADPEVHGNIHEILAEGEFGRISVRLDNQPSPDNPRTSYLAALSVLSLLADLGEPLRIGT